MGRLLELAAGLERRGWKNWVACRPVSDLNAAAAKAGLKVHNVDIRQDYDLPSAWRLARFLRDQQITIMHAHHSQAHAVCLLAKTFYSMLAQDEPPKLIVSRRVSHRLKRNPFSRYKYRSARIDRYIAVAQAVRRQLVEAGVPKERVEVIHSGVDLARFKPRGPDPVLREHLGIPKDIPLITLIGNASEGKGQKVFFDALARLQGRGILFHAMLAGRDTEAPWMRELVKKNGLDGAVTLLGFRRDVPDLLAQSALSVNAAIAGEALSGAMRESLAMEIPVVASDISGNQELVKDQETGLLFPPGDAQVFSEKMAWTLEHLPQARAMARKGRELVQEDFGTVATLEKTVRLYDSLAA